MILVEYSIDLDEILIQNLPTLELCLSVLYIVFSLDGD